MSNDAPRAPLAVERFVKQLLVCAKSVKLYPTSSHIPKETAEGVLTVLRAALATSPEMLLQVTKDGFIFENTMVHAGQPAYAAFAREFYARNLAEVRFHAGVAVDELLEFLAVLTVGPEELVAAGGFEARMWDLGISNITVRETAARIVDAVAPESLVTPEAPLVMPANEPPPDTRTIDDILIGAFGGRPRDQRILVRVVEDPGLVGRYLRETLSGRGTTPPDAWIANRLAAFSRAVMTELPEDQPALMRSLAEAVLDLPDDLRRQVIVERILPGARKDDALAGVLSQLGLEEITRVIVEGVELTGDTRAGLSRAIHNLLLLNTFDRDQVGDAVKTALRHGGAGEADVQGIMAEAMPARVMLGTPQPRAAEDDPLANILRLVDLASTDRTQLARDAEMSALRAEARRGITDGDVLCSLVGVLVSERRPKEFGAVAAVLDDTVGLIVDRGEYGVAADVIGALIAAESDDTRAPEQRTRLRGLIERMTTTRATASVAAAMRRFPADSPDHADARHLLERMSVLAVGPLLEVLADEPDMAARKQLIDLISSLAPGHVAELGARVTDDRWYFVRNVVAILAKVRTPAVVPYLERTLRYPDARVRRETIRAVAGMHDARATEMVLAALSDEDAQNVQLAARFLGKPGETRCLPALFEVARGEGRGNREIGPRVEAIEAIGRIGDPTSVVELQSLGRIRGLRSIRHARDLRPAIDAAVAAIARRGASR